MSNHQETIIAFTRLQRSFHNHLIAASFYEFQLPGVNFRHTLRFYRECVYGPVHLGPD